MNPRTYARAFSFLQEISADNVEAAINRANEQIELANSRASKYRIRNLEFAQQIEKKDGQLATQKEIIKNLRAEVANARKDMATQAAEMEKLRAECIAGNLSRGSFSALFARTVSKYVFPQSLTEQINDFQKQWRQIYPTFSLTSGHSGVHAYGEPTMGTIGRICHIIKSELDSMGRPIASHDRLLDWGLVRASGSCLRLVFWVYPQCDRWASNVRVRFL